LLIAVNSTTEYRDGISVVELREVINQEAGTIDKDDIFVDN
jgi:hypothetical protein